MQRSIQNKPPLTLSRQNEHSYTLVASISYTKPFQKLQSIQLTQRPPPVPHPTPKELHDMCNKKWWVIYQNLYIPILPHKWTTSTNLENVHSVCANHCQLLHHIPKSFLHSIRTQHSTFELRAHTQQSQKPPVPLSRAIARWGNLPRPLQSHGVSLATIIHKIIQHNFFTIVTLNLSVGWESEPSMVKIWQRKCFNMSLYQRSVMVNDRHGARGLTYRQDFISHGSQR